MKYASDYGRKATAQIKLYLEHSCGDSNRYKSYNGHVGNSYLLHPILALLSPSDFSNNRLGFLVNDECSGDCGETGVGRTGRRKHPDVRVPDHVSFTAIQSRARYSDFVTEFRILSSYAFKTTRPNGMKYIPRNIHIVSIASSYIYTL